MNFFLLSTLLTIFCAIDAKKKLTIGGLFLSNGEDYESEVAFRHSITRENMYNPNIQFEVIIKNVDRDDSYKAETLVCDLIGEGVIAIFGPSSSIISGIVASICNEFGIPHIIVHWEPEEPTPNPYHSYTRNIFPYNTIYARALAEVITDYDWTAFTILYDSADDLILVEDIIQNHEPNDKPITIRQLGPGPDYKPIMKELASYNEIRIVLSCAPEKITSILKQASEVKMLGDYQSYIITSIDAHTVDFAELQYILQSNITALRILNPSSFEVTNAIHEWRQGEMRRNQTYTTQQDKVRTASALFHDAVRIFAMTVREYDETNDIDVPELQCTESEKWEQGTEILKLMSEKTDIGMTGSIKFDELGRRTEFTLEILELSKNNFEFDKIATWDKENGVSYTRSTEEVADRVIQSLRNRTLIVASRIGDPYLDHRVPKDGEVLTGNARYKGYSMDVIDSISKVLGFNYEFYLVDDNSNGVFDEKTQKWDGLVRELLERKADLAICDLTITHARRSVVDFTAPFMTLGISILYAKPQKESTELFSFMSPLSIDVWLYMATAYLFLSIILFGLARMSAEDWENPHPCDENPEELESVWTMLNCTWLTVGSIMQQGCDLLPKAISTRLLAGSWWFFALIVISSYTANLAAFLTNTRMADTIKSVEDLANQNKIKYGSLSKGSTRVFFRDSNLSIYQRIYANMEQAEPSVYTKSNAEGIERVEKSDRKYAFFMESTTIEHIVNGNCNLTQVGGLLDSKSYGIALPFNSPYRKPISQTMLKLQEDGKLQQIKQKWWKDLNDGGCNKEEKATDDDKNPELGLDNVGGVFLVLAIGVSIAIIIGILEFLWHIKEISVEQKMTPMEALKQELMFAIDIRLDKKPVMKSSDGDSMSHKSIDSVESNKSKKSSIKSKKSSKELQNSISTNGKDSVRTNKTDNDY